jgi:hypothetical protein
MAQLSLSRAWEQTAAILVREGSLLSAVALALIVLPQVILAVAGFPVAGQATALVELLYIAVVLLGFVAQIAINRLAIGPSVSVKDAMAQGFLRLVSVFAALILLAIGLVLVAILLALILSPLGIVTLPASGQPPTPSLVVLLVVLTALSFAIFQLVFPVAAIETGNPIRLLLRSWQLGRNQYLRLLAFVIVLFAGLAIVALAGRFGVGSAVVLLFGQPRPGSISALTLGLILGIIQAAFTVVSAVMTARIYVLLTGGVAQPGVPNSGT